MAKSLQDILGYVTLTGLVEELKNGIPNPLPKPFMTTTKQVLGDQGRYTVVRGQRRTSRLTKWGSPALRTEMKEIADRTVKLLHSFEEQPLSPTTMLALRNYTDYNAQNMGMQEVARQVKLFTQRFVNLRIAVILMTLNNGVLYFDGAGNLLPTSSGAVETIDFGINANNQNQLNGIITDSWALTSTDIPLQLRNLKQRALQLTGYEIKYAFYGVNVPSYLTQNDYVVDYLARNPGMNSKFIDSSHGEIPDGLFDLTWVPAYTAFYEDQDGTNREIWGDDDVVFTPEVSSDWWEILEGSMPVPTTINIQTDAEAAMGTIKHVHGMGSYGAITHNPPTVVTYAFDHFLGTIKIPDAIYQADVTP